MTLALLILTALLIGATLGFLTACLFAAKSIARVRRESYAEGFADGLEAARVMDRSLVERAQDFIAQTLGSLAPLPESDEVQAEEERRQ